jgi:hypothetical protein
MVSSLQRSIGGLKASAQFVRVQFPAYKKKQVLKEVSWLSSYWIVSQLSRTVQSLQPQRFCLHTNYNTTLSEADRENVKIQSNPRLARPYSTPFSGR